MSLGHQYIEFEGLFSDRVLGIFRIIRGFADLRDLAAVSVPYRMEDGEQGLSGGRPSVRILIYLNTDSGQFEQSKS